MSEITPSADPAYLDFLREVKSQIAQSRLSAARAVNRSHIGLYWSLGRLIVQRQEVLGWGQAVVERLSADLRAEFPTGTGFSPQNLWLIRQFYLEYGALQDLQQLVGEIPWGHNVLIMQRVKSLDGRRYYLEATARLGWTRDVLLNQIKAGAHQVSLADKSHNFANALPAHLAEQAEEALKSRYSLEFLGIAQAVHERDLERRLIERLKGFLIELGYGFCFVGSQYRLTLGENEYFLDLLFYHRFLKCLVALELKTGRFRPEYAGKMDFQSQPHWRRYLSASSQRAGGIEGALAHRSRLAPPSGNHHRRGKGSGLTVARSLALVPYCRRRHRRPRQHLPVGPLVQPCLKRVPKHSAPHSLDWLPVAEIATEKGLP